MSDRSRPLVDPELLDVLEAWRAVDITVENLEDIRARWRLPVAVGPDISPAGAVTVSKVWVKCADAAPDVPVIVYQPPQGAARVGGVLHIHGGGFVGGTVDALEVRHRHLVGEVGCVLVSVDYRLAPETKFPGAVEDCYTALSWLYRNAPELGVDPQRIGVMGESAGGGLAAALALLARDRGEVKLAFQHLTYPMLDDRTCTADPNETPFVGEFVWTRQNNLFGWSALLGVPPGSTGVSPYAAPARAEVLTGLPPTFLSTAAFDLFLEENLDYARRLTRVGVPVELHVYPGAFHGFDQHPTATVARAARRDSLAALERLLRARAEI